MWEGGRRQGTRTSSRPASSPPPLEGCTLDPWCVPMVPPPQPPPLMSSTKTQECPFLSLVSFGLPSPCLSAGWLAGGLAGCLAGGRCPAPAHPFSCPPLMPLFMPLMVYAPKNSCGHCITLTSHLRSSFFVLRLTFFVRLLLLLLHHYHPLMFLACCRRRGVSRWGLLPTRLDA